MSTFWAPKDNFMSLSSINTISETCSSRRAKFLPYHRLYSSLDHRQLADLIHTAKSNHWQALDLSNCGIEDLPDELWELSELRILYLGDAYYDRIEGDEIRINRENPNTFPILPRRIEQLQNLEVLSLSHHPCLIEGDGPLYLPKLRHLDIYNCDFHQIPNAFLIPTLEEIGFNCLDDSLSSSFIKLENLRIAFLGHSNFRTLPENIGRLKNLEQLHLFFSKVSSLPESIIELPNLTEIVIVGTPLQASLPPEILNQSPQEIIRYILSQQSNAPKEFFNESKMIIVGQGHVGKTSLLKRLVENKYVEEQSTEGINISKWNFQWRSTDIQLNVWDFGGQEIYHSTHQFFLTKRSLYLLVWDVLAEKEYGRIEYWLRTVQSLADDSPILLVVNKCDNGIGRIDRIDQEEYTKKYPQIRNVFYVSCKDGSYIGQLRRQIKDLAVELPLMKMTWLTTWMNVRRRIEQEAQKRDSISFTTYIGICEDNGIAEEDEALSLLKYLHDLGIVLYYHDDVLLKNLVILSSEWGTDAVYKVLDEQERRLKGRNGILYTSDLPYIWKDRKKYPPEYYPHLLNLMEKFQLAFNINPETFLVAELLNNQSIDLGFDFSKRKTLSFRYEYDFLPAGVMTKFIVSASQYLVTKNGNKQCWRKGAYLQHNAAYALIRLFDDLSERYIQIEVSGGDDRSKRELLSIVRTKIDEINGRYRKIKITQRIPCCCSENCQFLFDYNTLLTAERKGKKTVECHHSLDDVQISKLLDGVEEKMSPDTINMGNIYFQPQITTTSTANSSSTAVSSTAIEITQEIKDCVFYMQGDLNDLKDEIGAAHEEFMEQCDKVMAALKKLENSKTDEDVKKSGAMSRIRRFLEDCQDPETKTGKLVSGIKHAAGIVKSLAQKYNKIAAWVALPQIPFINND